MEKVISLSDISALEFNKVIIGGENIKIVDSHIDFAGKNNILFIEDGVTLKNSVIRFNKDNSVIYLSKSKYIYYLDLTVYNDNTVYFGKNNYFNGALHMIASERQNIICGGDCLISFGVWIRTADPHLVYSVESKKRVNPSRSVFIGDHVWLGQSAMLLKGTQIGSGSIIGAGSIVPGKKVPSNRSSAGNPAKIISEGIFFTNECVHAWDENMTESNNIADTDEWIYEKDEYTVDFAAADEIFKKCESTAERLAQVIKLFADNETKNRFYF